MCSESDLEAQNSRSTLNLMMSKILEENQTVRFRILEANAIPYDNTPSLGIVDEEPPRMVFLGTNREEGSLANRLGNGPRHPFEDILARTWVYSRARDNATDMSFSTGFFDCRSWGVLSGISLEEVSNISIIALPISAGAMEKAKTGWCLDPQPSQPLSPELKPPTPPHSPLVPKRRDPHQGYTITIIGDGGVGKSSMASQLCTLDTRSDRADYTIQDCYTLNLTLDNKTYPVRIIDTSGQEDYQVLLQDAIDDGDGIIVVFSLDSAQSFNRAKRLADLVKETKNYGDIPLEKMPVALVGNKSDLGGREVGSRELATAARRMGCQSFECSARTGQGLWEPFYGVMRGIWGMEAFEVVNRKTESVGVVQGVETRVPVWI